MTLEDLKNLAEALQAFAVAAAVLAGGLWAVFRFRALGELSRARAELDQLRLSLERRASVNIAIAVEQLDASVPASRTVLVSVEFENVGNRTEVLDWTEGGIRLARVSDFKDGAPALVQCGITPLVGYRGARLSSSIDPREKMVYRFLVPVPAPGLYYLEFCADAAPEEVASAETEHLRVLKAEGHLARIVGTYTVVR